MKILKTVRYGFVVLLLIALTAPAIAEVTQNEKVPFVMSATIDCSGDQVDFEGYLHSLVTYTEDAKGGIHGTSVAHPAPVKGVVGSGPNEGAKYNGVGVTKDTFSLKKGETYTYVNRFYLIGQGKAPDLKVTMTAHMTYNANGEVTVDFDNYKITCK